MNLEKKLFILLIIIGSMLSFLAYDIRVSAVSENIVPSYQTEQEIKVNLFKKEKQLEVRKLEVVLGSCLYDKDYLSYKGKIINGAIVSFTGKSLGYFPLDNNLSPTLCEDRFDMTSGKISGGCKDLVEGDLMVYLPYFSNGKYADIYDPSGKKVLTIDLTPKATCNENDQCDRPIEDGENCPQDCKKNEPKIDPAVVQLAANNQATTQGEKDKISLSSLGWVWIVVILLILTLAGGLGYYVYRRNKDI